MGRILIALLAFGVLISAGCTGKAAAKVETANVPQVEPVKDPETTVFEQLRGGNYQINAALESLQSARDESQSIVDAKAKALLEPMVEVVDRLDEIGAELAEYADEPPTLEDVRNAFADSDDQRLNTIETASDALLAAEEVAGILDSLLEDPANKKNAKLESIAKEVDTCVEALKDAVKSLGGKVPEPATDETPKKS